MADQIISFAVKGVAGGIGLASESIKAHKAKKLAKAHAEEEATHPSTERTRSPSAEPIHSLSTDEQHPIEEKDEDQWALDDAQDDLLPSYSPLETSRSSENLDTARSPEKPTRDVKILIDIFFEKHPFPNIANLPPTPRLPFPVVLPQRRPQTRSRGFIRAYAPVLMNAGIDQATFLDYLELFDKASQASPWLNAINLAGFAFSFLPAGISMAISVAIAISVKVAIEMQSRTRTNTFLDRLNDEFFRPRGLFCLVLTWNPETADSCHNINLTSTLISAASTPSSSTQRLHHKFQSSFGNTYGELEFPETAPLVFPVLEHLATQDDEHAMKTKEKLLKKGEFVANYWDRRAQATYAAQSPNSMLVQGPKPEFNSRYADPTNPASSGNLISLLTGGHINPPSRQDMMQGQRGQRGVGVIGGGLGGGLFSGLGGIGARREMMIEERQQMMQQRQGGFGFGGGLDGIAASRQEKIMGIRLGCRPGMIGQDPCRQYGGRYGGDPYWRGQPYVNGPYEQYDSRSQMMGGNYPGGPMDNRQYQQYENEQRRSMDGREHYQSGHREVPKQTRSVDDQDHQYPGDRDTYEQSRSVGGNQRHHLDPIYNAYGRQQMNGPPGPARYGGGFGGELGGFNAPELLKRGVKKVLGKNVLYMMVVNMPPDEEMVVARENAEAAEKEAQRQM